MLEIVLSNVNVGMRDLPNSPGGKIVVFTDPQSGILVSVPLNAEACNAIATQLKTGLVIASNLTVNGKKVN